MVRRRACAVSNHEAPHIALFIWAVCLAGKSPVHPHLQKYIPSCFAQIKSITRAVSSHVGALAIVTNAGRDAVDAEVLLTNGTEADGEVVWF
jgi:hypothetical protein